MFAEKQICVPFKTTESFQATTWKLCLRFGKMKTWANPSFKIPLSIRILNSTSLNQTYRTNSRVFPQQTGHGTYLFNSWVNGHRTGQILLSCLQCRALGEAFTGTSIKPSAPDATVAICSIWESMHMLRCSISMENYRWTFGICQLNWKCGQSLRKKLIPCKMLI